jgi:predicted Rossmann fold nucleotide-binding protein DprA/Smf involved in DNA uptake
VLGIEGVSGGPARTEPPGPPPGPALAVWDVLDEDEAFPADELCRRTGLPAAEVSVALAALEIEGRLVRVPGVGYRRRAR